MPHNFLSILHSFPDRSSSCPQPTSVPLHHPSLSPRWSPFAVPSSLTKPHQATPPAHPHYRREELHTPALLCLSRLISRRRAREALELGMLADDLLASTEIQLCELLHIELLVLAD
jgi:hypothetical protein